MKKNRLIFSTGFYLKEPIVRHDGKSFFARYLSVCRWCFMLVVFLSSCNCLLRYSRDPVPGLAQQKNISSLILLR